MAGQKSESESYAEVPKVIEHHPCHQNHPLYLHEDYSLVLCSLCFRYYKTSSYQCHETGCDFKLHLECANLVSSIKHEEHHHLLTLIESSKKKITCENCRRVSNSFYARCFPCGINYHVQCGQQGLPATTVYEFHNHPLFLKDNTDIGKVCDACKKEINPRKDHPLYIYGKEWPMYNCKQCDYCYHVRCVISEVKLDKREKLNHYIHEHVLFLCDEEDKNEDISCCVCGNSTTFTYGCVPCSFYIHKSCIDKLPVQEIMHEFHPDHPLTLYWEKNGCRCDACHIKIKGFTYHCVECDFDVGLECVSKKPSIRDEGHPHLLTYFNKMYQNQKCITNCGFHSLDAAFLRCVQCDFSVHLLCSSLPREIKFKGHFHSLALQDYHIEDDFGEYYCDHCEGPRDPKECAYHCAEGCPYVVEFNCVIDEVLRLLNDGQVGVRKVDRQASGEYYYKIVTKGLYLNDVYKSSSQEEEELKALKTKTLMEFETIMDKEEYSQFSFSLFNSDAIEEARGKWWNSPVLNVDLKSQVVKVKNYTITKDLETLFVKLHRKYSDIGAKCSLSEGLKTIVLIELLQVIHEMLQTRIVKISEELFLSWLFRMLFVQQAGFMVDFVFKHANKVGVVRFGINNNLDSFPELKGYYERIEEVTDYIEARRAKLIKIKTEEKERTDLHFDGSSKEVRLRLLNNIDFTFETADKGLL